MGDKNNIYLLLEKLIELGEEYGVVELNLKWADKFIRYTKKTKVEKNLNINQKEDYLKKRENEGLTDYTPILAPISGTFYRSLSPEHPPLVNEGDFIQKDKTLALIEAMKLFNELKSNLEGKIVKILAKDRELVKKDQVLFLVDTSYK